MQLRVLLVDDEPGALKFLAHMISSRCPGWEVAGTAENGRQALARIQVLQPDLVLTDIRMPVMDGIGLAEKIHGSWPDIHTAIVSGYEDFHAAQRAMEYGVSHYLLKPVNPAQLVELLERAREVLLRQKRQSAAALLAAAVGGEVLDSGQLERCFHTEKFQAMLIRTGPLPSRYSARLPGGRRDPEADRDTLPRNTWLVAGRDERELLVFQTAGARDRLDIDRLLPGETHTVVFHREPFSLNQAGEAVPALLRLMDRSLVLGRDTVAEVGGAAPRWDTAAAVDTALEQQVSGMCSCCCRTMELRRLVEQLFATWAGEGRPLYLVQRDVDRLLGAMERGVAGSNNRPADHGPPLDEAILLSATMEELGGRVWNLILTILNQAEKQDAAPGSQEFFERVREYIEQNLSEAISLPSLCAAMGISQTYMSRIFRRHTGLSFGEYLTRQRIERSKAILREKPGLPLKLVAELVGYKDPFYFSKVFRGLEGTPPSLYECP